MSEMNGKHVHLDAETDPSLLTDEDLQNTGRLREEGPS